MRQVIRAISGWLGVLVLTLGPAGMVEVQAGSPSVMARLPGMVPNLRPASAAPVAGTWTTTGPFASGLSLLLTDGSILQQPFFSSALWQRIVPNSTGQYNWASPVPAASMQDGRGFFPSAVLRDGRVFVAGGEYGTASNAAEIYDPVANAWTSLSISAAFFDCSCVNLPDGRVLTLPNGGVTQGLIYDPMANSSTKTSANAFTFNEGALVQLPGGVYLTVSQTSYPATAKYLSATDQWVAAASAPTGAAAFDNGGEGTKVLLYDGRLMAVGQTGRIAFYTPGALPLDPGSWTAGPALPDNSKAQDAFSVVLPNGHVFLSADQGGHNGPTHFYEFDPAAGTFVDATPVAGGLTGYSDPYMALLLPTGQVFVAGIGVYTPSGNAPLDAWKPVISSIVNLGGTTYRLTGCQLNGLNEGAYYGDDAQMSTNYPLVRLTDSGGNVSYARTFNHSTMALATGTVPVSTDFTLPSLADGMYSLQVVTNAVPSSVLSVQLQSGHLLTGGTATAGGGGGGSSGGAGGGGGGCGATGLESALLIGLIALVRRRSA